MCICSLEAGSYVCQTYRCFDEDRNRIQTLRYSNTIVFDKYKCFFEQFENAEECMLLFLSCVFFNFYHYFVFLSGGTTCTVHEVTELNSVRLIHQVCGRSLEGNTCAFNGQFYHFVVQLFGGDVITIMKNHHEAVFVALMQNFEHAKAGFLEDSSYVNIILPRQWLETYEDITDTPLKEVIPQTSLNRKIIIKNDRMKIANSLFLSFLDYPLVTADLARFFRMKELSNVHKLMVVGEFSESSVLLQVIEQKLGPNIEVIVPTYPRLAVLNGAIMYGFEPEII